MTKNSAQSWSMSGPERPFRQRDERPMPDLHCETAGSSPLPLGLHARWRIPRPFQSIHETWRVYRTVAVRGAEVPDGTDPAVSVRSPAFSVHSLFEPWREARRSRHGLSHVRD